MATEIAVWPKIQLTKGQEEKNWCEVTENAMKLTVKSSWDLKPIF